MRLWPWPWRRRPTGPLWPAVPDEIMSTRWQATAERYRQQGGWIPWTDSDYTRLLPIVTPAARFRGQGSGGAGDG